MTERLIDAVCPHCGRVGTTVRVVLHEDGYTKLSRRCTDCGGECIHTFDHDWLSVARNKKLQADNEHLTNAVALVSERVRQLSEERDYAWGEVEKLRADLATQQGCCDGAAAQDAHIRREREEHKAEFKKLRADRRERIATAALPGLLSKWGGTPQQAADFAIQYADALIAELDKEEAKP